LGRDFLLPPGNDLYLTDLPSIDENRKYILNVTITKQALLTDLDYSAWANQRLLDACSALTAEELDRDLGASHGGVIRTLGTFTTLNGSGSSAFARTLFRRCTRLEISVCLATLRPSPV
jgi:hypothetical protein